MTLQALFEALNANAFWVAAALLLAPWFVWIACDLIPGFREEPFILSVNLVLAVTSLALWVGYLAYTTNTSGLGKVIQEANVLLLFTPPYYVLTSLWVSRQRCELDPIPAFRTLQGLALMGGVYLVLSWIASRARIIFFAWVPFNQLLIFLAILLLIGYVGYRRVIGSPPPKRSS